MKSTELHLVSHELCPYVQRSVIVLQEKGIAYRRSNIEFDNPPSWFARISPLGKVPVLEVDRDKSLFESAVICEYLDEITPHSLHPENAFEKARHRAWIEFGSGILDSIGGLYSARSREAFERKRVEIAQKFTRLEAEISGRPFFAGYRFHLIDAVYAPIFRYFDTFEGFVDLGIFENLDKVKVWRRTLGERASVLAAVSAQYPQLLTQFLRQRESYISTLIPKHVA